MYNSPYVTEAHWQAFSSQIQKVLWQIDTTSENKCDTTGTRFFSHFKLNVYKKLLLVGEEQIKKNRYRKRVVNFLKYGGKFQIV